MVLIKMHQKIIIRAVARIVITAGKTSTPNTPLHGISTPKNLKEIYMKKNSVLMSVQCSIAILLTCGFIHSASAQVSSWDNSPLNYNNSPLNYNNSSLNYNNSPLNYQNSPLNYNSTNGVYDNNGNRIGYQTQSPTGVTNLFDNNGNRIGYSPAGAKC